MSASPGDPGAAPDPSGAHEPEESADRRRRRVLWKMPSGLYLLGSRSGDRRNLMTLSWAMQVATSPKLVAVSVETAALTHELISESGIFALSILGRDDRAVVRRFVKPVDPSDVAVDADGLGTMRGERVRAYSTGAPVLDAAVAHLDCTVSDTVALGSHSLFVGQVVGFGFGGAGENVPVLRTEDTRMSYGG